MAILSIVLHKKEVFLMLKIRFLLIKIANISKEEKLALNINIYEC